MRRRLSLFFLIAILLPASALILLGRRVIRQEAELANARAADERRNAVEQLRRELSARLDAIVLQEVNRRIRGARPVPDPSLVVVTTLEAGRMVLPWETINRRTTPIPASTPATGPAFADIVQKGQLLEFRDNDFGGAADAYGQALSAAGSGREKCQARLMAGRALVKNGRMDEASGTYRAMVRDCGNTADDFGMRFGLYAAERLIAVFKDFSAIDSFIVPIANGSEWMPLHEAYLVRSLLDSAASGSANAAAAREKHSLRVERIERLMALAQEFPRIQSQAEAGWVVFGNEPWLISIPQATEQTIPLVFVVSPARFAPPMGALVSKDTPASVPLGEGFSGLRVEWQPGRFPAPRSEPASLYMTGLALIMVTTVFGAYLFLRDVRRDLRMAELRTHFVASVSHELKTPLTSIRMFAETLSLRRVPDEKARSEYLATIMNESERLTRLVDNVLDFSKIEQGKKVYQMKPTALPEVVRSAAGAMQYPLGQLGFTLKVFVDETLPALEADRDAIEQAILNLLSNAMKYSAPPSEIELRLAAADGEAIVQVTDHGIGISPDEQARIFEKFYRVRSRQTESIAGTGLGLTLVKHIAEGHGGRVEVRSAIGDGSTFSLRFPLRAAAAQEVQA